MKQNHKCASETGVSSMSYYYRVARAFLKMRSARNVKCSTHFGEHYRDESVVYDGKSYYYYHAVEIAAFDGETLILYHQGYHTPTTRDRLNTILSYAKEYGIVKEDVFVKLRTTGYIGSWSPVALYVTHRGLEMRKGRLWLVDEYYTDFKQPLVFRKGRLVSKHEKVIPATPKSVRSVIGGTRVGRGIYKAYNGIWVLRRNYAVLFKHSGDAEGYRYDGGYFYYECDTKEALDRVGVKSISEAIAKAIVST